MANLKELRSRIKSTNSTKRITSAMKMVAAAKLRRAEEEVARARPYFNRMISILSTIRETSSVDMPILSGNLDATKVLVVMLHTDRGLCGPLNSNLFKKVAQLSGGDSAKQYDFITVGRKGSEYIKRNIGKENLLASFDHLNTPTPSYKGACSVAEAILSALDSGDYGQCHMYYSRFVSAIEQKAEQISLMPFGASEEAEQSESASSVEYEPNAESVLLSLVKKALETTVYTSLLESFASEQGARMTAMDNANRNAGEMIDKLTITYNRSRQANITNELIEVISGAAAV